MASFNFLGLEYQSGGYTFMVKNNSKQKLVSNVRGMRHKKKHVSWSLARSLGFWLLTYASEYQFQFVWLSVSIAASQIQAEI